MGVDMQRFPLKELLLASRFIEWFRYDAII